ncbi:MAG: hypothetical protein HKN68_19245 [Saprospiraceae bacterium]|nr:hypothetical protein [Saprospiraceae bacterium]
MKYIILFISIIGAVSLLGQDMEQVTVPLSAGVEKGVLDVDVKSGSVKIIGTSRQDVLVKYQIIDQTDEESDENKESEMKGLKKISNNSMDFKIEEIDSEVIIKSDTWFKGVDLVVEVPQNFDLDINNGMGGNVEVENVSGELNLASYLGSVYAKNVSGVVNANTYTGEIEVTFNNITSGKDMSFISYTGKVDITLPATYAASLKMKTDWGDIYSDLDITPVEQKPEFKKDETGKGFKLYTDSWTYATINGGGPELTMKTQMGSIYLRKK